jgi:hypothetical protein
VTRLRPLLYTLLAITMNATAGFVLIGAAPERFPSWFVLCQKVMMIASAPVALFCLFGIFSEMSMRARLARMDKDLAQGWTVAGVIARERRSRLIALTIGAVVALIGLFGRRVFSEETAYLGMTALSAIGVAFAACSAVMLAATFLPLSADLGDDVRAGAIGGDRLVRRGGPSPYFLREDPIEPLDHPSRHRPGRDE